MVQEEDFSTVINDTTKDTEKTGEGQGQEKEVPPSSRKLQLLLLSCAALFSFGVLLVLLLMEIQHRNPFFSWSRSSINIFDHYNKNNDSDSNSNSNGSVKIPAEPCEDFYEFACAKGKAQSIQTTERNFSLTLQLILGQDNSGNGAEEKAQNFYKSCLKAAAHPESMKLNEKLNGMLEKLDNIPQGNLQEKLELLQFEYGLSPLFAWSVVNNVIQISSALEDSQELANLLKYSDPLKIMMTEILGNRLNLTGESNSNSNVSDSDFKQVVAMETEFQKLSQPQPLLTNESESASSMNLTLGKLEKLAGFINWTKFFNAGLAKHNLNFTVNEDNKILVKCPKCLSKLSKTLQNSTAESQTLLEKYLIWITGKEILSKILGAVVFPAASTSICSTLTTKHFKLAVISLYRRQLLKEYPDLETRSMKVVQEITENIREELIFFVKEAERLDEKSRDGAIQKARETRVLIGYPDFVKNSTLVEESYESFPEMNESDFIGNMMDILQILTENSLTLLSEPVDLNLDVNEQIDTLKLSDALENNGFAFQGLNFIFLPIRNLLPSNFHPESPQSFNYGRVGFILGHEFSHILYGGLNREEDDKFPSQNQSLSQSLRQKEEAMKSRSTCLVNQYSKFPFSSPQGKFLNGTKTLKENFADNVGLELATRAFFRLLNKNNSNFMGVGKEEKNETLNRFEDEKLFFTSIAQRFCTEDPPEEVLEDPHSPYKFRILGALQNSKAFSQAFNCPSKSPMNPEEKCSVF